jgi:site-specific recombinase XerD
MVTLREKGGKTWSIIVPEKAVAFLGQYLNNRQIETDIIFPVKRNGEITPIGRQGVIDILKSFCKAAGITCRISPYSFRHLAIS